MNGDSYLADIQSFSAVLPYIVSNSDFVVLITVKAIPGQHEASYNFLNYRSHFKLPYSNYTDNTFFSFNVEEAHFLSLNYDYYASASSDEQKQILAWVESDLSVANSRRDSRSWLIILNNRPMYCSNLTMDADNNCIKNHGKFKAFEDLFLKYNVDLYLSANEHIYER